MATSLTRLVIEAGEPGALARFWSTATGWPVSGAGPVRVAPPPGEGGIALEFVAAPPPRSRAPGRIHLDLASRTEAEQRAVAARLESAGARRIDIGQGPVPWTVLADPEGNELCVLEPRQTYQGTGAIAAIVTRASAPDTAARFWELAAGWTRLPGTGPAAALRCATRHGPHLEFLPEPADEPASQRIRPAVHATAPSADLARLCAAGARRTGSASLLLDPDGGELFLE